MTRKRASRSTSSGTCRTREGMSLAVGATSSRRLKNLRGKMWLKMSIFIWPPPDRSIRQVPQVDGDLRRRLRLLFLAQRILPPVPVQAQFRQLLTDAAQVPDVDDVHGAVTDRQPAAVPT